jgi:hypothetical protein
MHLGLQALHIQKTLILSLAPRPSQNIVDVALDGLPLPSPITQATIEPPVVFRRAFNQAPPAIVTPSLLLWAPLEIMVDTD